MKEVGSYISGAIDVLRARGDLKHYAEVDPGTPTTLFETFMLYCIRKRFDALRDRIAELFVPSTISGIRQLFKAYDDVADSAGGLPEIVAIKTNEDLQQRLQAVIIAITNAPIKKYQKQQMMKIINQERHMQYSLEQRYGQRTQPLSGAEAILWREKSGGSFFSLFPRIAAVQLGIDSRRSEPMMQAAYLYGANLQLLDDVVDIAADMRDGRQNALTSCMLETAGEYQEVEERIKGAQQALTYGELSESAPDSLRRIEDARAGYYQRIPDRSRFPIFDLLCNPKHTPMVMDQYRSRTSYK